MSYLDSSILGRAKDKNIINVKFYNPRDNVSGKYKKKWPDGNVSRTIDDKPFGGGPGMIIMAEPILKTIEKIVNKIEKASAKKSEENLNNKKTKSSIKIIHFSPSGKKFDNDYAKNIVAKKYTDIVMICGRYEGIDQRVNKIFKGDNISIGDYVLTGGELPAMVLVDCISRQVEGVLGNFDSREEERVSSSEVYTRPETLVWKNKKHKVPEVLLSGDHKKIEDWKKGIK